MEASHKRHRPHIKVGKDEEKKKRLTKHSIKPHINNVCQCQMVGPNTINKGWCVGKSEILKIHDFESDNR